VSIRVRTWRHFRASYFGFLIRYGLPKDFSSLPKDFSDLPEDFLDLPEVSSLPLFYLFFIIHHSSFYLSFPSSSLPRFRSSIFPSPLPRFFASALLSFLPLFLASSLPLFYLFRPQPFFSWSKVEEELLNTY